MPRLLFKCVANSPMLPWQRGHRTARIYHNSEILAAAIGADNRYGLTVLGPKNAIAIIMSQHDKTAKRNITIATFPRLQTYSRSVILTPSAFKWNRSVDAQRRNRDPSPRSRRPRFACMIDFPYLYLLSSHTAGNDAPPIWEFVPYPNVPNFIGLRFTIKYSTSIHKHIYHCSIFKPGNRGTDHAFLFSNIQTVACPEWH